MLSAACLLLKELPHAHDTDQVLQNSRRRRRGPIPFERPFRIDLKELKMSSSSYPLLSTKRWRTIATSCLVAATMLVGASHASAQGNGRNSVPRSFDVIPITITSVSLVNGQLMANGLLGSTPFQTPLTITATPSPNAACPILNLALGPIDLTLLGLRVETSPICLEITAIPGGGLLGDLLCGVANLLSGGTPVATAIGGLSPADQTRFLNGLTSVLDQVFDRMTSNQANMTATCEILSLSLGPLDLTLLGLRVQLDDCDGGPVTVDITAIPGGGLLGDLLCGLSNLLSGGGGVGSTAVQRLLFQISQLLGGLI